MKIFATIITSIVLEWFSTGAVFAGQAASTLSNAKQQAEAKGYAFFTSRDEIVAKAKQEGKLRLLINMEVATLKAAMDGFMKKYPFIQVYGKDRAGQEYIRSQLARRIEVVMIKA